MTRRVQTIMNLIKETSKLATGKKSFKVENKETNQLTSSGDKVILIPSSSKIDNCPVDDLVNYARETEEMLLNQISQRIPLIIFDFEDLAATKESINYSDIPKLVSEEDMIPFVQKTLSQDKKIDEDPVYIITEKDKEEETSKADAESDSIEMRVENVLEDNSIILEQMDEDPVFIITEEDVMEEETSNADAESDRLEKNVLEDNAITPEELRKRFTSKRSVTDIKKWKKQANYRNREKGLEYKGKKKENGTSWNYNMEKPAKKLQPRCSCKLSRDNSTKLKCFSVTENVRQDIFETFWRRTWGEKKTYVTHY